jgi:hypothetical protein
MEKRRHTLADHYRRLKRIIRFLHRRGTLFRSKLPETTTGIQPFRSRKKKQWRQWRKIKFLINRGTLIKKRKLRDSKSLRDTSLQQFEKSKNFGLYRTYRILRFLINTNRLFSLKKKESKSRNELRKKSRTYRRIRYLLKRGTLFRSSTPSPRIIPEEYFKNFLKADYLKIIINSTLLFLLAYCIVFLATNLATSFTALTYDIRSVVYYYKIDYLINSKEWKVDAIKVVYMAGPFFSLVVTLLIFILFVNAAYETWFIRLLIFWTFCHAFIHFFGELLIGVLMTKSIGLTIAYSYVDEYLKLLLIILTSSFIVIAGLLITKLALFTGNSYFNIITKQNRFYFLQSQFLIPAIIGIAGIIFLKFPRISQFEILVNLTILLLILPLVFRGFKMKDMYFDPDSKRTSVRLWVLLITGATLILYRTVFEAGLRIG